MPMIVALAMAATVAVPAVPMTPSGKWNVDYGATACMLGRTYGAGKTETVLALRQVPLSSALELMVYTNDRSATMRLGQARVSITGVSIAGGGSYEGRYESFPTQAAGKRMTRLPVDSTVFETLPADPVLTVAPDKMPGWAFSIPNAKAAFEALATCNDSTVKLWGVDPTERARIAQPAQATGPLADWIGPHDYPKTVLSKGAQGSSTVLWTINLDGRATDCRIVVTSGEAELDKAACDAITRRARYTPALGFDGKPMISHSSRMVKWSLPWTWSGKG